MIHIPSWPTFWIIDYSCTHINLKCVINLNLLWQILAFLLLYLPSKASSFTLHWICHEAAVSMCGGEWYPLCQQSPSQWCSRQSVERGGSLPSPWGPPGGLQFIGLQSDATEATQHACPPLSYSSLNLFLQFKFLVFSFIASCTHFKNALFSFFSPRMLMILRHPNHRVSFYSLPFIWSASTVGCLVTVVNIKVPKS